MGDLLLAQAMDAAIKSIEDSIEVWHKQKELEARAVAGGWAQEGGSGPGATEDPENARP